MFHRLQLLFAMLLLLGGYIDGLSCPSGEHQYSCSSCVSFVTDVLLNYTDAREMCRSRKADLVNVENARQAEIIRRFLESFSERRSVWIGQYYRNNTACYTASSNAGNWTQTPCTVQRPFICARTYGPASQLAARAGGQVLVVNAQLLKLNADISGALVSQLEWIHDSSTVEVAPVTTTNDTATLIIQSVKVSTDLGWYTLIAHDPATTYVLAAWLVKQARIEAFAGQPRSLNVSAGDLAAFECLPDPATTLPSASVVWYKNKAPLSPDPRIYVSHFTGTLAIMNVTTADAGVYFCKASNIAGTITSQNATLMVTNQSSSLTVQSTFLVQPRNTVVLSGDSFALECVPPFVKSSRTLIYTSDNALLTVLSDNVFPTYTVQSAHLADSNNYACVQWISPFQSRYSSNATVQVETMAQVNMIVVKLNGTVVINANITCVPRGVPMQLECFYTSLPPPTRVAWLLNGKEVTTGVGTSTSQVFLDVAYFDTPGVYQCLVSNIHGHSLAGLTICSDDIDTLPGNINFSVLPDSRTQMFVQWAPPIATPTTDPLLILYEVVYRGQGSPLQSSGMLENYRRDYQIKDLEPGTAYNVTVLAHSVGATSNGVWNLASTYGNVPVRTISGLSVRFIDDTSVQVLWDRVKTMPPEQPISSYLLTYLDNKSTIVSVTLGHLVSTYIITNISATGLFQVCMSYTAQIQRSPALFDANPSATCVNITDSLPDMGGVVPSPSKGASMNGNLLAIIITVAVVVGISVLIAVVLVALICQKKNGGRYSPARVEKSKDINPDRQRPMGQQVFDLAPNLSMLDEAFNSLSATIDMGIVSPKPTDLVVTPQPTRIALTPTKDEEML